MKRLLLAAGLVLLSAPAFAQSYGGYSSDNNPNIPSNSVNAYDRYNDSDYARDRERYDRDRAEYARERDAYYRDRDGDDDRYAFYDPRYDRDTLRHSPAYPLAPSDWDGSNGGRPRNISRDGFNRDY